MSRIGDIYIAQGRNRAEGARASGDIWGPVVAQLGQIPANLAAAKAQQEAAATEAAYRQRQQELAAAREQREVEAGTLARDRFDFEKAQAAVKPQGPNADRRALFGIQATKMKGSATPEAAVALIDQNADLFGLDAATYRALASTPDGAAQFFELASTWAPKGPDVRLTEHDPSRALVDPTGKVIVPAVADAAKPQGLLNVPSGGSVYDPVSRTWVQPPEGVAVEKPATVGTFEDYVRRFAAEKGVAVRDLKPKDIETARKRFQQADDQPRQVVPVVIQTSEGPQLLDRATRTAAPITTASGDAVKPAPTSAQRDAATARGNVGAILDSVAELSEKINTGQGVVAKATGAIEKQKARVNLNDDVAEYEALVSAFTPLWARALGHTGQLTEPDVASAKEALPKPGDSKTLRDRKLARIHKIFTNMQGGSTTPAPAPSAGGGTDPLGIR